VYFAPSLKLPLWLKKGNLTAKYAKFFSLRALSFFCFVIFVTPLKLFLALRQADFDTELTEAFLWLKKKHLEVAAF
jgi:hypothetical protein